jgi:sugar/nucleoside kinase (ribokinase family)
MFAVIGSTSVDVMIDSPEGLPKVDGDEFTSANLVFTDEPLRFSPGGNACISAYVLAALGAEAALCSAVGTDVPGSMLIEWLEEVGVDLTSLKQVPSEATSTTTIISAGESRLSFHHPGALRTYRRGDLAAGLPDAAEVLLVCSYPLLRTWRPEGYADVLRASARAGVMTALDIGPAVGAPVLLAELADTLPHVDYFLCNRLELERFTGTHDLADGMLRVARAGAACVVTKLGPCGAAVLAEGARKPEILPAVAVEARGTVGAGDSFNAGFLYARRAGRSLRESVRFGTATASLVVASPLGVRVRPSVEEVERILRT